MISYLLIMNIVLVFKIIITNKYCHDRINILYG